MLPLALENPKPSRIVGQVDDRIVGFTAMICLGKVVDAAIDHLHRERCERLVQLFGNRIRQVDQDGIQQTVSPYLKLDAVLRADPKVR